MMKFSIREPLFIAHVPFSIIANFLFIRQKSFHILKEVVHYGEYSQIICYRRKDYIAAVLKSVRYKI